MISNKLRLEPFALYHPIPSPSYTADNFFNHYTLLSSANNFSSNILIFLYLLYVFLWFVISYYYLSRNVFIQNIKCSFKNNNLLFGF